MAISTSTSNSSSSPSSSGAQQSWKPHALANPHQNQLDLSMGDTVRSTVELTGVPVGSEGKINWLRYRVRFANGLEIGDLDQRNIEPIGKTAKRLAKIAKRAK
jgi:hypothetical protein